MPPASWMRANTSSGGAPIRGTNAGRPVASQRSKASAMSATCPPPTSARAIQGRPDRLRRIVDAPAARIASASSSMPCVASRSTISRDAIDAALALLGEERLERRRRGVDEVAEHVDVHAVGDGRDLDAGDELDAGARAGRGGRGATAADRVVIGDDRARSRQPAWRAPRVPPACSVRRRRSCGCEDRSRGTRRFARQVLARRSGRLPDPIARACSGRALRLAPRRSRSARYSPISRSRCARSSSANSRKICLPSESSNRSP